MTNSPGPNQSAIRDQLRLELSKNGVEVARLAMFYIGGNDQIVGEVQGDREGKWLAGGQVRVKNAVRVILVRGMRRGSGNEGNIETQVFLGPLEFAAGAVIEVHAQVALSVADMNIDEQNHLLALLLEFHERHVFMRAQAAGIAIPGRG